MLPWFSRGPIVAFASLVASNAWSACSDDHHATSPTDVVYEGAASDEALTSLLGAPIKAEKTVAITSPAAGSSVAKNSPATFSWGGIAVHAPRDPDDRRRHASPRRIVETLVGIKTAHAHGAALSGSGYYLQFTRDGAPLLSVFTSNTTYAPTAAAWEKLGTGEVRVALTAALFDNNNIARDGGPYASAPLTFTVTP